MDKSSHGFLRCGLGVYSKALHIPSHGCIPLEGGCIFLQLRIIREEMRHVRQIIIYDHLYHLFYRSSVVRAICSLADLSPRADTIQLSLNVHRT